MIVTNPPSFTGDHRLEHKNATMRAVEAACLAAGVRYEIEQGEPLTQTSVGGRGISQTRNTNLRLIDLGGVVLEVSDGAPNRMPPRKPVVEDLVFDGQEGWDRLVQQLKELKAGASARAANG